MARIMTESDFHRAVDQILGELGKYGYSDAHAEKLPADGKVFYGTFVESFCVPDRDEIVGIL